VLHSRTSDGDANAVEIRDYGHDAKKNQNFMAKLHRLAQGTGIGAGDNSEVFEKRRRNKS